MSRLPPRQARADSIDPWPTVALLESALEQGDPLAALARGAALLPHGKTRSAIEREIVAAAREPAHPFDTTNPVHHAVVATHLLYLALIRLGLFNSYLAGLRLATGRHKGASKGGMARMAKLRKRNEGLIRKANAARKRHPNWSANRIAKEIVRTLSPMARVSVRVVGRLILENAKNATD